VVYIFNSAGVVSNIPIQGIPALDSICYFDPIINFIVGLVQVVCGKMWNIFSQTEKENIRKGRG
jgi:hypothetical protein